MESATETVDIPPTAPAEEKKKYQRPSKYTWDRSSVTLDTKLVELPKKAARLVKPEYEACEKKIKDVEDQIKHTIERKKKIIEELILKSKENAETGNQKSQPLREQFNEKKETRAQLQKEFEDAKNAHNEIKNKILELTEKQKELRLKMKGNINPEQLEERLEEVEHSLNNDVLTIPEEKKLVKEREELERALPYAVPIKNIAIQLDELNKRRKEVKPVLDAAYEKYSVLKQEISGLVEGLDELRTAKTQDKEKTDPLFGEIRAEYDAKIEALKNKKKDIRDEFRVQRDKYEEEQDDIRYYDWAKRIQDNLRRDKQRLDREAQEIAAEEAAEKKKIDSLENPNQALINDCDMLVKYCAILVNADKQVQQEEEEEEAPQREVNLDDLKKEKLQIMAPKKEIQRFAVNNKKKNQAPVKKQANKATENVKQILNLPLDIINAFESVNVRAPIFAEDVQAAVVLVQQKLVVLQEQGEKDLVAKKQALLSGTSTSSDAANSSDAAATKKTTKVYHQKETDFPTL